MDEEEILTNPLDNLNLDDNMETPNAKAEDNSHQDNKQEEEQETEEQAKSEEQETEEQAKSKELTAKDKRHAEQQEWAKREVDKLRSLVVEDAYEKAQTDAKVLLELGKKDPIAANLVAKKFWYDDFKDAKAQIHAELGIAKAEPMSDEEKEAYYQERRSKEIHEEAITEAKAVFNQLPDNVKKQALDDFDELSEWKTLNKAKAMKIADMISLSLNQGKAKTEAYKQWVKQLSNVSIAKKSVSQNDDESFVVVDGKIVSLSSKNSQ